LKPSVFSIGGIVLAIFMLLLSKLYTKIMNIEYFYKILIFVEVVMLFLVTLFLLHPYNYTTALLVYIGYQVTFVFGSYLVRAETLVGKKRKLYTFFDSSKQLGYLVGMALSYIFYQILERFFHIDANEEKVYMLHFLLLLCELTVIHYLYRSFSKER
jgi:hypothetical protein